MLRDCLFLIRFLESIELHKQVQHITSGR